MIEIAACMGIVLQGAIGLVLIGLGVAGFRLHRAARRPRPVEVDWRAERRARRRANLRAWQADFDALVPPPEPVPCDGSNHNHVDVVRFGSREVQVVCVPRSFSAGGAVLAPGEAVFGVSAAQAVARMREAFGSKGAQ